MTRRKYFALRMVSTLLKVISFLIIIGSIISAVVYFLASQNSLQYATIPLPLPTSTNLATNILYALGIVVVGLLLALLVYGMSNIYDALIALEENTRRTNEYLEALVRMTPVQR